MAVVALYPQLKQSLPLDAYFSQCCSEVFMCCNCLDTGLLLADQPTVAIGDAIAKSSDTLTSSDCWPVCK